MNEPATFTQPSATQTTEPASPNMSFTQAFTAASQPTNQIDEPSQPPKPQASQKTLYIIIGVLVSLLVLFGIWAATGFAGLGSGNKTTETEASATPKPKKRVVTVPVNTIDVSERPYLTLEPTTSGRDMIISLYSVKKDAPKASYTLEYQSGSLLQGVQGELETTSLPSNTTQLLGSCSAGGACTIHKDVRGGNILVEFTEGAEDYAIKEDFSYTEGAGALGEVTSSDKEFTLKSAAFTKSGVVIVLNSSGYPGEIPGTLVSNLYSVTTAVGLGIPGKGTVSIKTKATGDAKLAVYDGTEWTTVTATVKDGVATAEVTEGQLFAVVE